MLKKPRNEDLINVFERRWKANHNNDLKDAKQRQEEFNKKMYGERPKYKPLTNEEKLREMNKNIENLRRNNRPF